MSRLRGFSWPERAAMGSLWLLLFVPFYGLGEFRASLFGSAVVYASLAPLYAWLYVAVHDGLNVRATAWALGIRRAAKREQLVLHYQPKLDFQSGRVIAAEALVRWEHPRDGLVPPSVFVPRIEDGWYAKAFNLHVLNLALREWASWSGPPDEARSVCVNLSPKCLEDPLLPEEVGTLLRKWRVPPDRLELEITELALSGDHDRLERNLEKLRAMGIRLSLDDFGVGHSSIARLVVLPLNVLKVDRSCVIAMNTDARMAAAVKSAIDLGHALGLIVVAEGIEDEATWKQLRTLGCDVGQGFLLAPPVPTGALADAIAQIECVGDLGADSPTPAGHS